MGLMALVEAIEVGVMHCFEILAIRVEYGLRRHLEKQGFQDVLKKEGAMDNYTESLKTGSMDIQFGVS
jgi:hypothetical protein